MRRKHFVLDKPVRRIYNLNQLKVGDCLTGIPNAEYYKNNNSHEFIKLGLDYGYATCHIYFLIFSFPIQKLLHNKYVNSFELVKYYRQSNGIAIDNDITQLHNIDWSQVIDWLNQKDLIKLKVISKNTAGFRNIKFLK